MAGAGLMIAMSFGVPTVEGRLALLIPHRVPLWQAKSFSAGIQASVYNGYPAPALERIGAPAIPVFCFGREGAVCNFGRDLEELQPYCDALNELVRGVQSETGQTPASSPPLHGAV